MSGGGGDGDDDRDDGLVMVLDFITKTTMTSMPAATMTETMGLKWCWTFITKMTMTSMSAATLKETMGPCNGDFREPALRWLRSPSKPRPARSDVRPGGADVRPGQSAAEHPTSDW